MVGSCTESHWDQELSRVTPLTFKGSCLKTSSLLVVSVILSSFFTDHIRKDGNMARPERSDSSGLSWADQWDYKNQDVYSDNSGSNSKSKMAAYNQRMKAAAGTGLGKAKSAATVGVQKVKSGTLTGVNWIKERVARRKSKS